MKEQKERETDGRGQEKPEEYKEEYQENPEKSAIDIDIKENPRRGYFRDFVNLIDWRFRRNKQSGFVIPVLLLILVMIYGWNPRSAAEASAPDTDPAPDAVVGAEILRLHKNPDLSGDNNINNNNNQDENGEDYINNNNQGE